MRRIWITAAIVLLLSLLLAISALKEPRSDRLPHLNGKSQEEDMTGELFSDEGATVHVNVSMNTEEFEWLREMTNRFTMKYPSITIDLINDRNDSAWLEEAELGTGADVMLLSSEDVRLYAGRGLLKPAGAPGTGETAAELLMALTEPLKWNGYSWGTPKDADPALLVWNKSRLTQMGYSSAPAQWSEFAELAEQWETSEQEIPLLYLSGEDAGQFAAWLDVLPADGTGSKDGAKEDAGKQDWLAGHWNMVQTGGLDSDEERIAAIVQNKLVAGLVPWSVYSRLAEAEQRKLLVGKGPVSAAAMEARSFVVAAAANSSAEAALWVEAMTSTYEQQRVYEKYGKLPAIKSLYAGKTALEAAPPAWLLDSFAEARVNESSGIQLEAQREQDWRLLAERAPSS